MNRRNFLTREERELFGDAVKNVKPLKENKNTVIQKIFKKGLVAKNRHLKPKLQSIQIPEYPQIDLNELAPEEWVGVEDAIHFNRTGLQDKLLKKLAQGHISIEGRLDLHRMNLVTALAYAESFLQHAHCQGHRLVLIIHGKGKKSDKPILKNALNFWLRREENVLAFHSAQPKDGGSGAVYVLIKKAGTIKTSSNAQRS